MAHPRAADLEALLESIAAAGVEVIVVGGAAAVLHGAPVTTLAKDRAMLPTLIALLREREGAMS